MVVPQNGWFIMENPINNGMILGGTTIFGNTHFSFWQKKWYQMIWTCFFLPHCRKIISPKSPDVFFFLGPQYHANTIRIAGCFHIGCTDAIPSLHRQGANHPHQTGDSQHISEQCGSTPPCRLYQSQNWCPPSWGRYRRCKALPPWSLMVGNFLVGIWWGDLVGEIAMMIDKWQYTLQSDQTICK